MGARRCARRAPLVPEYVLREVLTTRTRRDPPSAVCIRSRSHQLEPAVADGTIYVAALPPEARSCHLDRSSGSFNDWAQRCGNFGSLRPIIAGRKSSRGTSFQLLITVF